MSNRFTRSALFAALLALGVAGGVSAQAPGSGAASGSTTTGASSGAGSASGAGTTSGSAPSGSKGGSSAATSGTDKGAGTGAAGSSSAKAGASLSGGERRFVETAARHGMAEVQLGKMAQDKAQDPQVKDFGRRMAEDHGKANDQLKTVASAKGVTLPTEPDNQHKRLADRLGKMSGAEFDRTYMKEMVDDHEKDVREFRNMAKSAKDAEVRAFAAAQLPTLEEHLKMAQALEKSTASSAKGGGSGTTTGSKAGAPDRTSSSGPSGGTSSAGGMGASGAGTSSSAGTATPSGSAATGTSSGSSGARGAANASQDKK